MASYLVGGSLVVAVVILVKPILFPTIISFPWLDVDDDTTTKRKQTVILAGSYNPPHLGHLAMLRYLSKRYEKVIAVIGFNPNKKYPVSPEQRKQLLQMMIQTTDADNIEVAGKTFGEPMDCLLVMASLTWMGLTFSSRKLSMDTYGGLESDEGSVCSFVAFEAGKKMAAMRRHCKY
jgi:cytidyltransferase-like protein